MVMLSSLPPQFPCAGSPGFGYIKLFLLFGLYGSFQHPVTHLSLPSKMEVAKGHSAQLLSGRASVFPSSSPLSTSRHSPGHLPASLPFCLSLIHPSGAHSAVFQESQDKQWEFEMLMATQLMTRGCAALAHDYRHLHTPQRAHTLHCLSGC